MLFRSIELVVTISLIAVLASLAVPSYRAFIVNQQLTAASGDFMVSLLQARSEAVRLGKNVAVAPVDGTNWTSGWNVFQDTDCTGTYSSTNSATNTLVVTSQAMGPAVSVVAGSTATSSSFAAAQPFFAFAPSGFITPYSCAYAASTLSNGKLWLTAAETGRNRVVIVAITGRARVCIPSATDNCSAD